jgi:CDP-glucose 4,6-dehydratase
VAEPPQEKEKEEMKAFITGYAGLIGAPLTRQLIDKGWKVYGLDMSNTGTLEHYGLIGQVTLQQLVGMVGSVLDLPTILHAVRDADIIIHLAAQSGVWQSREEGYKAWELNFMGTLNALESARIKDKPIIIASSNHVYGNASFYPTPESGIPNRFDPYSASKIAGDIAARSYAETYGVQVVSIRNTNCFGPADPHTDHIIPGTILSVLRGEAPVIRSSGRTSKNYLHVDDVASAYALAAEAMLAGKMKSPAVYNVSDNAKPSTVVDLVTAIIRLMGSDLTPVIAGADQPDDVNEQLDSSMFRALTGWKSRPLEDALYQVIESFKLRFPQKAGVL